MNYVSAIKLDTVGLADSLSFPMGKPDKGLHLTMRSLVNGQEYSMDSSLVWHEGILGCARNAQDGRSVVICNKEHTARLHEYIEKAQTYGGTAMVESLGADTCERNARGVEFEHTDGNTKLVVDTVLNTYCVCGKLGSVAWRKSSRSDSIELSTLYEFLGVLSNELGINLMSYEQVQFYSRLTSYTTTIRFKQTVEAKRYLTKMAFDVLRPQKSSNSGSMGWMSNLFKWLAVAVEGSNP